MRFESKYEAQQVFKHLEKKRVQEQNPVGWFRLFDLKNKKFLYENHNLVVGLGRQYVAQKIVTHNLTTPPSAYSLTDLPSGCDNLREYEITHYAFGSGGATYSGPPDDYDLTGPSLCDTSLTRPITFAISSFLDDPGEIDEGDDIHTSTQSVKPIYYESGNNTYEYQLKEYPTDDPECEYYTQMQFTLFKEEGEFGPLEAGESVQVSEAGLYITYDDDAKLFARICFPPKFMEKEGLYGIEWFILC